MIDPWDLPVEPKKVIITKKDEPKEEFVPSRTIRQAEADEASWMIDDIPLDNRPQKFDIIEDVNVDMEFIDEVNNEIADVVIPKKQNKVVNSGLVDDSIAQHWKDNGEIVINFSLIDKMYYKGNEIDHCPAKIYGNEIGLKEEISEPMIAGNLFETLLLGGGRDGEQTYQLERKKVSQKQINEALKKGLPIPEPEMKIDEIRIRHQVERSKVLFFNHKIQVVPGYNTQVPVYKIWNGIKIWGHLDLFPTPIIWEGKERIACLDTKLTANLMSTFGKYCWGDPGNIDFTQAMVYYFLLEDIDYSINPYLLKLLGGEMSLQELIFLYYVADYKVAEEKLDSRFFEVEKTKERIQEVKETIRKTHSAIEMYREQGWPTNPTYDLCKNCVQNHIKGGKCTFASNNQKI